MNQVECYYRKCVCDIMGQGDDIITLNTTIECVCVILWVMEMMESH